MEAFREINMLVSKIKDGSLPVDEPLFVLRGRDLLAAGSVTAWAVTAAAIGVPQERVDEAMALAEKMRKWETKRVPGVPESEYKTSGE